MDHSTPFPQAVASRGCAYWSDEQVLHGRKVKLTQEWVGVASIYLSADGCPRCAASSPRGRKLSQAASPGAGTHERTSSISTTKTYIQTHANSFEFAFDLVSSWMRFSLMYKATLSFWISNSRPHNGCILILPGFWHVLYKDAIVHKVPHRLPVTQTESMLSAFVLGYFDSRYTHSKLLYKTNIVVPLRSKGVCAFCLTLEQETSMPTAHYKILRFPKLEVPQCNSMGIGVLLGSLCVALWELGNQYKMLGLYWFCHE